MRNRITETLLATGRSRGISAAPAVGEIVYAAVTATQKVHALPRTGALARIALVAAGTIRTLLPTFSVPVSRCAANSTGVLAYVQPTQHEPLHKPLRSVWIPVLTSTLSGFAFVKSRQRKRE